MMPSALVASCCLGVTMGERGGDVDKGLPEKSYFIKGRSFTELPEVGACETAKAAWTLLELEGYVLLEPIRLRP